MLRVRSEGRIDPFYITTPASGDNVNPMIEARFDPKEQMCRIGRHSWSVPRLFHLARDLPVMDIPLKHINMAHNFDEMRIRDFLRHMKAVQDADLSYPIILDEDGEIMDGRHRLMKAILGGHETIKAVRFDKNPDPCQERDDA